MLKLRELRLDAKKTQADIAIFLGTSRQVYANYENGINEPSLDTLARLADFFECTVDYLLGREDDFGNIIIQKEKQTIYFQDDEKELLNIFKSLHPQQKFQILEYARFFNARSKKRN